MKFVELISTRSMFKLLIGFSICIQLVVISYSHYSGYYALEGISHFFSKLLMGTSLTFMAAIFLAYPDLYVIRQLNGYWSWGKATLMRVLIQVVATLVIAGVVSVFATLFSNFISTYQEPLVEVFINNALIFSVCNLILMIIFEAWIFYIEKDRNKKRADELEREASQIRFEVLKAQINPHFMFNSLNVLAGLIDTDHEKAQLFIEEFSQIYRYILDTIDQYVVTVEEELRFAKSYMYLQQIRYGTDLHYAVNLPAEILKHYLPPLALQSVLENVMKHNMISDEHPLTITISDQDNMLVIRNNLQPKSVPVHTSGLGQKNLAKRYHVISKLEPNYRITENTYSAHLPVLLAESNENFDYRR